MTPPRLYIAAVNAPDWLKLGARLDRVLTCGIAGVDVRIGSLDYGPSKAELELALIVASAGLDLRCHAWVGHRSGDVAAVDGLLGARDGHIAAAYASELGARAFGANAERDVWRGEHGRAHPHATDYLGAFATTFHGSALGRAALDYVGFASPSYHYLPADLDQDGVLDTEIQPELRARYRRVGVMAYQSTLKEIQATLARARKRWPEHAASGRLVPWLGVGRLENGEMTVGNAEASKTVARECGEAVFYVGFGAIGQLLDGHPKHPPLVSLVPQIVSTEAVA